MEFAVLTPKASCGIERHQLPDATAPLVARSSGRSTAAESAAERAGVTEGARGLAGDPAEFEDLLEQAASLHVSELDLVRDYWLTAALHQVASAVGTEAVIYAGQGRRRTPSARAVFAGGTSLVSAWGISARYSIDLDMLALMIRPDASHSARKRPPSLITKWATEGLGLSKSDAKVREMGDVGFRRVLFAIGGVPEFLTLDITVEDDGLGLHAPARVSSLIGRYASSDQLQRYPELGGFTMVCATPAYTAANKFDALHRRAVTGDLRGLFLRARDLYDLAAIAISAHGQAARDAVPHLAHRASLTTGRRVSIPRPRQGYSNSILFKAGSQAQESLHGGYQIVRNDMAWRSAPTFEQALEQAASLD